MEYREHLSRPLSKDFLNLLIQSVIDNPADFSVLYQLVFDANEKVAWRAAWACEKLSERFPEWFSTEHANQIRTLSLSTKHGGLHRLCLSILTNLPLPNPISVEFINSCFEWMISPKYPIAVQALSMKMLYAFCEVEPDFKAELKACLENVSPDDYSPGYNSIRRNILKKLNVS